MSKYEEMHDSKTYCAMKMVKFYMNHQQVDNGLWSLSISRLESGFGVHVSFLSAYMNTRVLSFDIILTPGKHFKVKLVCFKSTMFLFFLDKMTNCFCFLIIVTERMAFDCRV